VSLSLEDMLHDRAFLTKMLLIGFFSSLVFIAIGIYIILLGVLG
jgi:hypothetical protein